MKKGFTLAEILIVLTIIGVMAVMTIPSLMQNANSQQKIAQFKKAFNAVSNAYATEFAIKSPPKNGSDDEKNKMWDALNNQLNVKYYLNSATGEKIYTKEEAKQVHWNYRLIITEDKLRYKITSDTFNVDCKTKLSANSYKNSSELLAQTCIAVGVYLDNSFKYCYQAANGGDTQNLNNLKCSAIEFYVTKDGITTGNPDCTITGRIISDNTTYDPSKCK